MASWLRLWSAQASFLNSAWTVGSWASSGRTILIATVVPVPMVWPRKISPMPPAVM